MKHFFLLSKALKKLKGKLLFLVDSSSPLLSLKACFGLLSLKACSREATHLFSKDGSLQPLFYLFCLYCFYARSCSTLRLYFYSYLFIVVSII